MAHVAKYQRPAIGHMCAHFDRSANNIDNKNIKPELTHLNYNLAPNNNQVEFIKKRCSEIQCSKRKDVNVLCAWVVTAPKNLPQADEKKFFEATYEFLKNRYGEKNIVSSFVHADEVTPHMHFAFVPVVTDKKKSIEKVCAKELLNKYELKTFHSELEKHLAAVFGREVGILNEATRDGNKSVAELKRLSAVERLNEVDQQAEQIISEAKNKASEIAVKTSQERELFNKDIKLLIEEKNRLQGQINEFNAILKSNNDIDAMGSRSLIGGKVTYTAEKDSQLKAIAKASNSLTVKVSSLKQEVEMLSEYKKAYDKNNKEINELRREVKFKDSKIKQMENVINSSAELKDLFNQQANKREVKTKNHTLDFER
ncbi:MAG: plasmid recombination protein [Paludibacter sp.]|nr:plasmid recombination protein [Paludibacter sp.]